MSRHHGSAGTLRTIALLIAVTAPVAASAAAPSRSAEGTTARRHEDKGVACADCHGKAKPPRPVEAERCLACHGPASALVEKTARVKPANPHDSPHWGADIECNVCHRQHAATVNWCAYCHRSELKVP